MSYSSYIRTINLFIHGQERRALKELNKVILEWNESDIQVNARETIIKIKNRLKRMDIYCSGLIWCKTNHKFCIIPATSTQASRMSDFIFDRHHHLRGYGTVPIADFTDHEIYEGATSVNKRLTIAYNNIAAGGYAANLRCHYNIALSKIYRWSERLERISDMLQNYNIQLHNLAELTLKQFCQHIAKYSNHIGMYENIIKRLVQILLNEMDVSQEYCLHTASTIFAREYGNFGFASGLLNSLFLDPHSEITLALLVKAGLADCRGTNALYAILLNIGYKILSTERHAKIIYVKMAQAVSPQEFSEYIPDNHNIVLVNSTYGIYILDAYFDHVDNILLRYAIQGCSNLGQSCWAVQIAGLPRYPPQQRVIKLIKN